MKITRVFDKKENRWKYKARFQINKIEFTPDADTKSELNDLIEEIRVDQRRLKNKLIVLPPPSPFLKELFKKYLPTITKEKHKEFSERVFEDFLKVLPENIKVTEFKTSHFQIYADWRKTQINRQSGELIQPATINKEMYAAKAALKKTPVLFPKLSDYDAPKVPRIKVKRKRRERLVDLDKELYLLLAELRKDCKDKLHTIGRKRLADELEFRYETGMRKKEVINLKPEQYSKADKCLRTVQRFKTETVTTFIPLSERAVELIESRLQNSNSEFIFSDDGKPKNNNYYTLKTVCEKLGMNYGRFKSGGFIPHDLRHNFVTEILQVTDIETARTLTGHSSNEILTYLHTNETRQRDAIAKRDKKDSTKEIVELYKGIKRRKIKLKLFVQEVKKIAKIAA